MCRVSYRGQKKLEKGREYALVSKVAAGEGAGHLPAPPIQNITAAATPPKPSACANAKPRSQCSASRAAR
ncbi:hypothetical protein MTO96_032341 [Rhipicephalus appendiculatus]